MKKVVFAVLFSACAFAAHAQDPMVIRYGVDPTFAPFESIDPKGDMVGIDIDLGMEKLSMEWTCGGYVKQALTQYGMLTHNGAGLRFAGGLQSEDLEAVKAVELVVRGRHSEIDFGTAKPGDDTALKIITSLSYYKLTIDGEELIEIDVVNMIKRIGGKDLLENFRLALGL